MIGRPISVAIATLALVVLGFFSLLRLPVSLLPTLERPRVILTAVDAELPREELEQQVVEPLERRLLSLNGVLEVHSTVDDGECHMVLESEWQTDVDRLRIDVERRLGETAALALDQLNVRVEASERTPILELVVRGGGSAHVRTLFADEVLIPELSRLEGAGLVRRLGGAERRPVVRPAAAALAARGLTAVDVAERLREVGSSQPVGRLRDGGVVRPLVWREAVEDLEALRDLRFDGNGAVLRDVAQVSVEEVPAASVFRLDGEPAVLVEVHRAPGANAVRLSYLARELVRELRGRMDGGMDIQVLHDASVEVVEALRQLALAGLAGLVLGALVLRFVLRSWRPTLALVVVVPASVVSAFGAFYLWGVSLDLVSLAGLALAAGMLVDNSIVVLEAIESARARGSKHAEVEGSRQIAMALVASFLTTAVVFLPLIYLRGLARAFFGVQAFAIVSTLAISLLLSLSLTPVLARSVPGPPPGSHGRNPGRKAYLGVLGWALGRPWSVGMGVVLLLACGVGGLFQLPRELVPAEGSEVQQFEFRLPAGLETSAMEESIDRLEAAVATVDAVRRTVVYRGRDAQREESFEEVERGRLEWMMADGDAWIHGHRELAAALGRVAGVEGRLRSRPRGIAAVTAQGDGGLEVELTAGTAERVRWLSERLEGHLAKQGIFSEVVAEGRGRPSLQLRWDALRLAALGMAEEPLEAQVRAALGGFYAGRLDLAQVEPEILLEATRPEEISLVPVSVAMASSVDGGLRGDERIVPLAALARIEEHRLAPPLERRNGRPSLRMAVAGGVGAAPRLAATLEMFPRAVDEGVRLTGQVWEMQRSFGQLRLALGLALVLVFLTVAALYESFTVPLVVMTTVPVAAAGAIGALWLGGQSLNVMSFLGLILLAGIVVNNAIVLVHRIEQRLAEGIDSEAAVRDAAAERYRPILMTTVTTLLGMLPLAVLGGEGVELRRALALSVSGGLLTSLFAALVVVPVFYRTWVVREKRG